MTDMQETCFNWEQTQRSGLSSDANGFFYLSHQSSGQKLKSKNCLQALNFFHPQKAPTFLPQRDVLQG